MKSVPFVIPRELSMLSLRMLRQYVRLEVEGVEHVPPRQRAILAPNHSGVLAMDAAVLSYEIFARFGVLPKILAHKFWFIRQVAAAQAKEFGLIEASYRNGVKALEQDDRLILFPEGERGNFKPTSERYQLQPFRTGFIRMAMATDTPIVPTVIIGAEESHLNLTQFRFMRQIVPLPLNLLPLPAKWKIRFLEPMHIAGTRKQARDPDFLAATAAELRSRMQSVIREELAQRRYIFFPPALPPVTG